MATGVRVGVGGAVKTVKGIYVGVGGQVKKVTKGYVGVGGVPKLFYSSEASVSKYTGSITATNLSASNGMSATTRVGVYAIFGECTSSSTTYSYNASLVRSSISSAGLSRWAGTYTNTHGICIGTYGNYITEEGTAYTTSLSRSNLSFVKRAKSIVGRTSNGSYALRMGGFETKSSEGSSAVWSINTSLTVASAASLKSYVNGGCVTNAGDYTICFNGNSGTSSQYSDQVTFYNNSLTRTTGTFPDKRYDVATASTGTYGIMSGGYASTSLTSVKYYNGSLTLGDLVSLSYADRGSNGCSISDKSVAMFSSQRQDPTSTNYPVWYYNDSLTKRDLGSAFAYVSKSAQMERAGNYCIISIEDKIAAYTIS